MTASVITTAFVTLHMAHWIFYALLLCYAVPPISAAFYVADGVLVLWAYTAAAWLWSRPTKNLTAAAAGGTTPITESRDAFQSLVLAAIIVFGDTLVAAETLDTYHETQRSLTQGRAGVHLALTVLAWCALA